MNKLKRKLQTKKTLQSKLNIKHRLKTFIEAKDPMRILSNDELNSPYFHSVVKGCKIVRKLCSTNKTNNKNIKNQFIRGGYCKTHRTEICHCGWEWKHHYETL